MNQIKQISGLFAYMKEIFSVPDISNVDILIPRGKRKKNKKEKNVKDSFSFLFHLSSSHFLFCQLPNVSFDLFCTETTGI